MGMDRIPDVLNTREGCDGTTNHIIGADRQKDGWKDGNTTRPSYSKANRLDIPTTCGDVPTPSSTRGIQFIISLLEEEKRRMRRRSVGNRSAVYRQVFKYRRYPLA
jgi:hypothetical protein